MKIIRKKTLLLLFCFSLLACNTKQEYNNLTSPVFTFCNYQIGDQFKLRNHITNKNTVFTILEEEDDIRVNKQALSDNFTHRVTYFFSNNHTEKGKASLILTNNNVVKSANILINGLHFSSDNIQQIAAMVVNGITYKNVILFKKKRKRLYYASKIGFLKIDDNKTKLPKY